MFALPRTSLISSKISKFYTNSLDRQNGNCERFYNGNGTFNAKAIVDFIWSKQECSEILKGAFNNALKTLK